MFVIRLIYFVFLCFTSLSDCNLQEGPASRPVLLFLNRPRYLSYFNTACIVISVLLFFIGIILDITNLLNYDSMMLIVLPTKGRRVCQSASTENAAFKLQLHLIRRTACFRRIGKYIIVIIHRPLR